MPRYIVRKTLDYSIVVEADDEHKAIDIAMETPEDQWECGDYELDAELEEENNGQSST